MSELTLLLIRFAYLAILWIFVLSAISVIRSDMFGARVPEAARGAAAPPPRKSGRGPQARPSPRRTEPRPGRRGRQRRRTRRPRPGAPAHRARQRRGHPPRRRLRLDPARPHRRVRRPVVRRGPRLHQRHVRRQRPHHPADHDHARHPGAHRQDDPRAQEVSRLDRSQAGLLGDLRRRAGAQGQPGLRVRRPLAARGRRRRRRCRPRRPRVQHGDPGDPQARPRALRRPARRGRGSDAPRPRPHR